ncbi:MAG TPA: ribose-5-phosphate isomerase RpiA [Candidatus Nanopelagicaceae bacterium]|nr:ribose-5-phosphate isomerase RpiA [Candidatus Nanopelagicaceae bacterium]
MAEIDFQAAVAQVGAFVAALIEPGMRLGLGTGRTTSAFLEALRPRLTSDFPITAVCTSTATEEHARAMGIAVLASTAIPLDLDIDGADEIDPALDLIKGGGGAMVREKVVAERSRRFWVIADAGKLVQRLGEQRPVPLEVLPFDWEGTAARVAHLTGSTPVRRGHQEPFITDNGNFVLDLPYRVRRLDPDALSRALEAIPGIFGHGLFLKTATAALISDGRSVTVSGDLERRRDPL